MLSHVRYRGYSVQGFKVVHYQSHYNKELNKCLILINQKSELNGQPIMAIELHDPVERRSLASYTQLTKERKEYLLNCELKPTSQEKETICKI